MSTSPSTANYALGRGILSVGEWAGTTPPDPTTGFKDLGNCNDFKIKVTEEKLEHFSKRSGLKKKDKTITLEIGYEGSFQLDEVSAENLALFVRGTIDETSGTVIKAATKMGQEFAIKFVSDNPTGPTYIWKLHKCELTPNSDFGLISDEWAVMEFTITGLADEANNATSPYFDIEYTD